jgi:serine/threonine protein kinase
LTKSDIFSLGATLYEASLGRALPMNGPEWQDIRAGSFERLPDTPIEMEIIIREMMKKSYSDRPTAAMLLKRPQLMSEEQKLLMSEKNKVFQAKLALAQQAKNLQKVPGLARRNTWSGGYF